MAQRKRKETPTERIEDALQVTQGRIPMTVVFDTQDEIDEARAALKKKKKGKNLRLVTRTDLEREREEMRAQWAREDAEAGATGSADDQTHQKSSRSGGKKRGSRKKAA